MLHLLILSIEHNTGPQSSSTSSAPRSSITVSLAPSPVPSPAPSEKARPTEKQTPNAYTPKASSFSQVTGTQQQASHSIPDQVEISESPSPITKAPAEHKITATLTKQATAPKHTSQPSSAHASHPDTTQPPNNQLGTINPETQAKARTPGAKIAKELALTEVKGRIVARLRDDLRRHFSYPRLAQKRGWEGKVTLLLEFTPNGNISKISIDQSSSYKVLDKSAVETLARIGGITEAASWLNGRALKVKVPVIYNLISG